MSNNWTSIYTNTMAANPPAATNAATGALPTYTISANAFNNWNNPSHDSLTVEGDAKFEGDVAIKGDIITNGKSLSERLDKIEQRLGILQPNKKLEEKWARLKSLGDMYRELEQEIIEKEHIWASLKK